MTCRRFLCITLALLAACWVCFVPNSASAQMITIPASPLRTVNDRPNQAATSFSISRSDCLKDDVWTFTLNITNGINYTLDTWVGVTGNDCTLQTSRTGTTPSCTKVVPTSNVTGTVQTVRIRAQDIAPVASALYGDRTSTPGTAANCTLTSGSTLPQSLTLYFMLFLSGQTTPATFYTWPPSTISSTTPFNIDLLGPGPPTGITAEGASTFIKVGWTINVDTDVQGYKFFCDPPPGGRPEGGIDAATSSSDASSATCSTPEASTSVDAADDGSDGSDDADSSSSPVVDAGTCVATEAGPIVTCGGSSGAFFVAGQQPSADVLNAFSCGQVGGNTSTSGIIQGFGSYATVAVAVASVDLVGNVGPLSGTVCATTEPVNGFIDLYNKAGGTAGGGFCSIGAGFGRRVPGGFASLFGAFVVVLAVRRRRGGASN
jgi:hypothetical protein